MHSRLTVDNIFIKYSRFVLIWVIKLFSFSNERRDFLKDAKVLHCKKEQLTFSADSIRDAVSRTLHESLPLNMDSTVRERIIYINDARVLSSFPEYKALPRFGERRYQNSDAFEKQIAIRLADVNLV